MSGRAVLSCSSLANRSDPALHVPLYVQTEHLIDLMHSTVDDRRTLRRWWAEAITVKLISGSTALPDFFELETARRLLHAVRLIDLRRAVTRVEALQKSNSQPLDVLTPIAGSDFIASRDIHQILCDLSAQQLLNVKLERRLQQLEARVSRLDLAGKDSRYRPSVPR